MIKRIIFDVDLTLLNSYKDCMDAYFEFYNDEDLAKTLYDLIDIYEQEKGSYDEKDLANFLNDRLDQEFKLSDLEKIREIYRNHSTLLKDNIPDILKNLSSKYELVALTKWYLEDQEARLEKANILKYFTKVYAIGNAPLKPSLDVFITACGDEKRENCLVVGDSIQSDVKPALEAGLKAIYYNPNNIETNYQYITDLSQLSDIIEKEG